MIKFWSNSIILEFKKISSSVFLGLGASLILASVSYAAVGCTLNDPDRDVKRLFPEATGYKTEFITIKEVGGQELFNKIEQQVGDNLDTVYETIDVPYAFYDVLQGKDVIAHIHGVNQKGKYGGMQLILATDLKGKIVNFFYQKMSSPEATKFMDNNFTKQFIGLSLDDFLKGKISAEDPTKESREDFLATLRGLKKNLILLDELKINRVSKQ